MQFADVIGHDDVKKRLREMVDNDRLPHALLIQGPRGTGKLKMARALVTYLHCTSPTPDGDSCGRCPSCIQHANNNHIDLHYSFPTLKRKSEDPGISAEFLNQWIEFLDEDPYADITIWLEKLEKPNGQPVIYKGEAEAMARNLSFTPRVSNHKVALIWLPERFQREAANKLLKLIEEPFPDTKMIFVSDDPRSILPTIYSRLQRVEIKKLTDEELAAELKKQTPTLSHQVALGIAHAADGDMISARTMSVGGANETMLREFIMLMRLAFKKQVAELKRWAEDMASTGREGQIKFLDYCCRLMRENFISNTGVPGLTRMTPDEEQFAKNFSKFINSRNVLRLIDEFQKASADIAANGNAKIVFFDLALQVIILIKS